ncbi:MAG: ABC transporter substrate-binding protein [Caldilinea sp. CFX5]|nr:ABC transporter substrate-binding protein [Caldilinea sp. CFX5]
MQTIICYLPTRKEKITVKTIHSHFVRKLYAFLSVLVIAMLVVACAAPATTGSESTSSEAAPAESSDSGEVSREETLIFGSDITDILTLDPAVAYEFSGIQAEGSVYETLVSFVAGQTGVQPALAESWEVTEEGDMWALTFKLNPNAKFASGNPVTADDVVYSWGRAIDLNKSPAFLLIDIGQVKKENLSAVDAQTFQVKIPKSISPQVFLSVITFTVAAVVEKAVVEANAGDDMGSTWLNDNSAGSGPYVLNKWERNVQVVLDANPNYWGEAPKMKRVIMTHIGEAANRQAAIETGDADIVQDLSPEQKTALEGNADVQIVTADNTQLVYIGMNAQVAPFDNPDVREAVRYAINYDEVIALTGGDAKLVQEVIPAGFLGHTGQIPFKQDIAKAKELLAQAGVPEGTEITALVPSNFPAGPIDFPTLAAKIQSDLAQIGLTLNLQQLQVSELLNIYRSEDSAAKQMVFILWGPDYPDPDGNMTPFTNYAAKSIAWRNGWDNPEIAEMVAQAAIAPTAEERVQMYADITERVFHEGPYVILYQPLRTYAVRSNIDGFTFDPSDTPNVNFATIGKK